VDLLIPLPEGTQLAGDPWTVAIYIAVTLLAQYLLKQKSKSVLDDSKSPLASRGSFVQYVIGLAPVEDPKFLWRGRRNSKKEKMDGGKGSDEQKQKVYYESGWHALAFPGPGQKLHEIRENGEPIWTGPIDRLSHPSGSTISAGKHGSFKIYWGEPDQPIDTFLPLSDVIDIASRWPYLFYVVWINKRLGTSPLWGRLSYLVEVGVNFPMLSASPSQQEMYVTDTLVPIDGVRPIMENVAGPPGTNYFIIQRDVAHLLPLGSLEHIYTAGTLIDFTNGQAPTPFGPGLFPCLKCEYTPGTPDDPFPADTNKIYLAVNVNQVSTAAGWKGDLRAVEFVEAVSLEPLSTGINPIHGLAQYLFAPWPYGRGWPTTFYDLGSFEEGGVICDTERIPGHLVAYDGEKLQGMIGVILQEAGFFLAFDVVVGLWRLKSLRYVNPATVPVVPAGRELELPSIERDHRARPAEKISFSFHNKDENFSELPIVISNDGQASIEDVAGIKRLPLYIPIDQIAAGKYAGRRGQEEVRGTALQQDTGGEARLLTPGDAYKTASRPYVLRLIKTEHAPLEPEAKLSSLKDNYGGATVDGTYEFELPPPVVAQSEPDLFFSIVELPSSQSPGIMRIIVPRIRAHDAIESATIWLSPDDVNYYEIEDQDTTYTGGPMAANWPGTADPYHYLEVWEEGPVLDYAGPDIDSIPDLSGDETSWYQGKLVMIFDDGTDDPEICFFRNLTPVGAGQVRVDGVIRARFGTPLKAHVAGTTKCVYLFQRDEVEPITDTLLVPKATLYCKTQPRTSSASISLAQVTPDDLVLVGRGVVPDEPSALRTTNGSNSFATGTDVSLTWQYEDQQVPFTGAGDQPAGLATGTSPIFGTFTLRFLNTSMVEKLKVENIATNSYVLDNTALGTAFAGEPTSFYVGLTHALGGLVSPETLILIQRS